MSWVEKTRKINSRRGDDYSGLENIGFQRKPYTWQSNVFRGISQVNFESSWISYLQVGITTNTTINEKICVNKDCKLGFTVRTL